MANKISADRVSQRPSDKVLFDIFVFEATENLAFGP